MLSMVKKIQAIFDNSGFLHLKLNLLCVLFKLKINKLGCSKKMKNEQI